MEYSGLRSVVSWRTYLVGFLCGYVFAWCVHRTCYVWAVDRGWVEESVPYLVPGWSKPSVGSIGTSW